MVANGRNRYRAWSLLRRGLLFFFFCDGVPSILECHNSAFQMLEFDQHVIGVESRNGKNSDFGVTKWIQDAGENASQVKRERSNQFQARPTRVLFDIFKLEGSANN